MSGPEVVRALQRAGFVSDRQHGSHVILFHPDTEATASVPCPGSQDLAPGTLRRIIRDAGLTVAEFVRLLG